MGMYAMDAGSKYLVEDANLEAAYEWLESVGEFAYVTGHVGECTVLSADGNEELWCGDVGYGVGKEIEEFLNRFCEPGSYACQRVDDFGQYDLYWKDDEGVHSEGRVYANPFDVEIRELESLARRRWSTDTGQLEL